MRRIIGVGHSSEHMALEEGQMIEQESVKKDPENGRRYDIDWLRILAVLLLVPYHTAVIFTVPYVAYIKDEVHPGMEVFAYFMNQWHMSLFFLVSGAATWFSLTRRTGGQYIVERITRLLVPLLFGTFAIVPVQVYFQRIYYGDFSGSYLSFYPHIFDGIYPHGNFTWGQLWFLAYLFVFSSIALPIFLYLKSSNGRFMLSRTAGFFEKRGRIFLAAIPLALAQAALRAKWPGFQNLYDDWANFAFYITVFVYGYILCSDARFASAMERNKAISLAMAIVSMGIILGLRQSDSAPAADYSLSWILYMLLHGFSSWCWLVAFLGFARKYLCFTSRLLKYGTEAALPFYILHHAVIVVVAYHVVPWDKGVIARFIPITLTALAGTTLLYDIVVRRVSFVRFLFGMKPIRGR